MTLLAAGTYAMRKRQIATRLADVPEASQIQHSIDDAGPDGDRIGLPIIRAIGFKKLVPILAIGALHSVLSRRETDGGERNDDPMDCEDVTTKT